MTSSDFEVCYLRYPTLSSMSILMAFQLVPGIFESTTALHYDVAPCSPETVLGIDFEYTVCSLPHRNTFHWERYGLQRITQLNNSHLSFVSLLTKDCLPSEDQRYATITLTPHVIPNTNYLITTSDLIYLILFCLCFLYRKHQVHREFFIIPYHPIRYCLIQRLTLLPFTVSSVPCHD